MTPEQTARQFQAAVEAGADEALKRMAAELARIVPGLVARVATLTLEAEQAALAARDYQGTDDAEARRLVGEQRRTAYAASHARSVSAQVEVEINRIMGTLTPQLIAAQDAALVAGGMAARALTESALPEGLTLEDLRALGRTWQTVPIEAVRAAVGAQMPGSALADLLGNLGAETGRRVQTAIVTGVASGRSPREVGQALAKEAGLTAVRAMTIARTEQLRAFRTATRMGYEANPDIVKGYRRLAAKSARSCPACLGLDGKEYLTADPFASHPNCRCSLTAITPTWHDLGFDVPDTPPPETGAAWLAKQDEATQRAILGRGGLKAYQAGVPLERFAKIEQSDAWGPTVTQRPLSEVTA